MRNNANTIPISNQLIGWLAIKFGIDLDDILVWRRFFVYTWQNVLKINEYSTNQRQSKRAKWQRNDVIYLISRVNVMSVRIGDNSLCACVCVIVHILVNRFSLSVEILSCKWSTTCTTMNLLYYRFFHVRLCYFIPLRNELLIKLWISTWFGVISSLKKSENNCIENLWLNEMA